MKRVKLLKDTEPRPAYIPLSRPATVELKEGPKQINREGGKRRIVASANVRGRDLGSVGAEAQQKIDASVKRPAGYWVTWGGQFENLIATRERLVVVMPLALVLIFMLLFASRHSIFLAALVFTGVPLALTGCVCLPCGSAICRLRFPQAWDLSRALVWRCKRPGAGELYSRATHRRSRGLKRPWWRVAAGASGPCS